ncbi:MAG: threonine synthase [Clostridia bacterium]
MFYESTRNNTLKHSASEAIIQGISPEGGLYVPETFPVFSLEKIADMVPMDYRQRAEEILALFLSDYPREEIRDCVNKAYREGKFDRPEIAPVHKLSENQYILELWHGPTCAFKDMALQSLPNFMEKAQKRLKADWETVILVATSGDTGKAALEGFRDVSGISILVFYPEEGVSQIQKLQMVTQEGKNLQVAAVRGNFDATQNGVKELFTDQDFVAFLEQRGYRLSSANSINWGRLVPQIVYYFSAYDDMVGEGYIDLGEKINVVVPTGNFGNILAAYYAGRMGLPIHRLICASNQNNVLTDFFREGQYNRNREFYKTISPSMDILISSNLERLLYEVAGRDNDKVKGWMEALKHQGQYHVGEEIREVLGKTFWAGYAPDEEAMETIRRIFHKHHYLMDPHTAVGQKIYEDYREATGDENKTLLVSTASPYKFTRDVAKAILGEEEVGEKDDFALNEILAQVSGMPIPAALQDLKGKPVLHTVSCQREAMRDVVMEFLQVK